MSNDKATQSPTAPTPSTGPAPNDKKSDIRKVKVGSVFSRHSFGVVVGRFSGVEVKNLDGMSWTISPDLVEKEFSFADQFDVEVTTNRTSVVGVLVGRPYTAMTVKFRKKVDLKDAAEALFPGEDFAMGPKLWRSRVEEVMAGEVRTMEGFHSGEHDAHGRLKFTEIVNGAPQQRLIDPRTVFEVICHRTRYTVEE